MGQPKCKSCQAPIRWGRTDRGKGVPLDPEPVSDGNLVLDPDAGMVMLDGDPVAELPVRHLYKGEDPGPDAVRYRSHFATCPDADDWRGQGRGAAPAARA